MTMTSPSTPAGRAAGQVATVFPGPPKDCPLCGESDPKVVVDGGGVHFRCSGCGAAIYVEQGRLWALRAVPGSEH
jgi:hypothetical protein